MPYVADVGWDGWDEIDAVAPGANYGWPCYEGRDRTTGYRDTSRCKRLYARGAGAVSAPLLSYPAASVTGGTFYTGDRYPERYRGAYFYGDWAESWLRYLPASALTGDPTTPVDFASRAAGPVQIKTGSDGNLLYLALNAGELRRVVYTGG